MHIRQRLQRQHATTKPPELPLLLHQLLHEGSIRLCSSRFSGVLVEAEAVADKQYFRTRLLNLAGIGATRTLRGIEGTVANFLRIMSGLLRQTLPQCLLQGIWKASIEPTLENKNATMAWHEQIQYIFAFTRQWQSSIKPKAMSVLVCIWLIVGQATDGDSTSDHLAAVTQRLERYAQKHAWSLVTEELGNDAYQVRTASLRQVTQHPRRHLARFIPNVHSWDGFCLYVGHKLVRSRLAFL